MSKKSTIVLLIVVLVFLIGVLLLIKKPLFNPNKTFEIGQKIDSLHGVYIFYNGSVGNVNERNLTSDGYNLGLKFQCVEFVKRYYYEYYKHKMPDSYGNAKDFFDEVIQDGKINSKRNLLQFKNPSKSKPQVGDLLIFDGHLGNKYGHVAIISQVHKHTIELIQQNPGPYSPSRVQINLDSTSFGFKLESQRLLGWLRIVK